MWNHTQGAPAPSQNLSFDGTDLTIIDRNGRPWLAAADLARALGYSRADKVSRLYRENSDEFTQDMTEVVKLATSSHSENTESGFSGNLQKTVRVFSPRGCHLLAMFARTEKAKHFRKWVLDVLDNVELHPTPARKPVDKASPELSKRLRSKVSMAAHSFRFKHKAEHAIQARIRTETGAQSVSKLTTAQCLQAIDLVEMLTIGIHRHNNATARAEDQFLKNFVREDAPMPLQPYLLLTERDDSRSILPVEVSALDLAKMSTNAVGKSVVEHGLLTDDRDGFIRPWEETDGEG